MTLDEWFAQRNLIVRIYREELDRDVISDTDALVNWLQHWREENASEQWIRDRVRESPEWKEKHPQVSGGSGNGSTAAGAGIPMNASDTSVRERPTLSLPTRGPFQFPAPWNTQGVRITNESDGQIEPVGYSYWNNVNAHGASGEMLLFAGRSNASPLLFTINKRDFSVFNVDTLPLIGLGERWYFSKTNPRWLYIDEGMKSQFVRYDVFTRSKETIFEVDPKHYLWQGHSSADDRVHSATLRDRNTYEMLGAQVCIDGKLSFYPKQGEFDECQVDKSGKWLVIKENDYNRIVNLETGEQKIITNVEGAVGHSDCGYGYVVGENDTAARPGAMHLWNFDNLYNREVYYMHGWTPMSRHVSHCNAPQPFAIVSSACSENLPRANEIVKITLDGSMACTVLAPTLVELSGGDNYRQLPKANVDPSGEWVTWSTNNGSGRTDILMVKT